MFNHKRLITLSIAASMVIPSLSTMTVLANEPFVELNDQEENISLETANNLEVITLTQQDLTTPNSNYFTSPTGSGRTLSYTLKSGNYKLDKDVDISFTISVPKENTVNLDLNDKKLTNKETYCAFAVSGSFTLTNGKISHEDSTAIGINSSTFITTGKVTISKVEIESKYAGSVFEVMGASNELIVENSSINGDRIGISVPYFYGNTGPTIKFTNVNLTTTGHGVWQTYPSTINLENCKVESAGLASQIGTLNISNSVLSKKDSESSSTSSDLSTNQAHIRFIPNKVGPLTVNIANSEISGNNIGLLIADKDESNTSGDIKIDISNTTIKGSQCNLGYVGSIPFTLTNVMLGENKENKPEKLAFVADPKDTYLPNDLALQKDTTSSTEAPYTINASNSKKMEITITERPDTLDDSSILTKEAQDKVETALSTQINNDDSQGKTSTQSISVSSWNGNSVTIAEAVQVTLNYTYEVTLASPLLPNSTENGKYTFQTNIAATLSPNSIIGLVLPLVTPTTQSSEIMEELETFAIQEKNESDSYKTIYVELNDVLKNEDNVSSGLSAAKIQKIFKGSEENKDIAPLDANKLSDFEKIDLTQAFEMKDIGEVIEIKGTEAQKVIQNTPTSTGSSKPKPKPEAPAEEQPTTPGVGTPTSMYRLYNRLTGEHLYTTNKEERDSLLTSDTWKDEGQGWTAPSVSDFPVYRLLNPNTGDHHYTTDRNEFDTLPSYGWIAEGIAFFSADKDQEENVILHRVYNPNAQGAGSHHYTTDKNERDSLIAQGWINEGTAWAGLPTE